mgnify:CR=1 FL=1
MRAAVLLNDTRCDRHHGCDLVVECILATAEKAGIRIVATAPAHCDWQSSSSFTAAFSAADLIIVNGEGTVHHDRPSARYLLNAGVEAQRLGKPSALINTTWYRNGTRFAELAASFDLISVRESTSAMELKQSGLSARIVPDLALLTSMPEGATRAGIAYSDCVVASTALQLHERMHHTDAEFLSMFHQPNRFRSLLRTARRYARVKTKSDPVSTIASIRLALIEARSEFKDRDTFLTSIASKKLIVTGRFHMMVLAMASRTPFLVIESNTPKCTATLTDSGLARWRSVREEEITPELMKRASLWEADEPHHLEAFISSGKEKMERLFADLVTLQP